MPNLETLYAMEVERRLRLEAEVRDLKRQLWDAQARVVTLEANERALKVVRAWPHGI